MARVIIYLRKPSRKQLHYFGEDTWRPSFLATITTFKQLKQTIKAVLQDYMIPNNVSKVYYIPPEKEKPLEVAYRVLLSTMEGDVRLGKLRYLGWIQ